MTSRESRCAICGRTFTVEYPEYVSPDEDPAFVHGVGLKLNHGPGRFLASILACSHCTGELLILFSSEGAGTEELTGFIRSLIAGAEEEPSEDEDVPSDEALDTPLEETPVDEEPVEDEPVEPNELSSVTSTLNAGDVFTEEDLYTLESEAAEVRVPSAPADAAAGEIFTEEMLHQIEEGRW